MAKYEKGKETGRITDWTLGWEIVEYTNPDGTKMYYLNRKYLKNGVAKTIGYIVCTKQELLNLRRFMTERKFE